ncbi:hypothetical protein LNP74_25075 [Klebsiella pneumoniae subsp. pneumoniae]|nr:hypothetical protein [Klebsiella pneumoniae subsp. pneumoniae]
MRYSDTIDNGLLWCRANDCRVCSDLLSRWLRTYREVFTSPAGKQHDASALASGIYSVIDYSSTVFP